MEPSKCNPNHSLVSHLAEEMHTEKHRVLIVKSIAGTDLPFVLSSDKAFTVKLRKLMKKDLVSKRDEW
jgi:hypothetical protein